MSKRMNSTGPKLKEELIQRSMNYHGQQLTNFIQENPSFKSVDVRNVDYHLYHGRSKELRMEDRGRRLVLHRFISQTFDELFGETNTKPLVPSNKPLEQDCVAPLPPFEVFLNVDEVDRTLAFFETVELGDVLYCKIGGKI